MVQCTICFMTIRDAGKPMSDSLDHDTAVELRVHQHVSSEVLHVKAPCTMRHSACI